MMKIASCLSWVRQGVAAEKPLKVKLTKEEQQELLISNNLDGVSETSDSEVPETSSKGLRGSIKKSADISDNENDETAFEKKYRMDRYDESDDEEVDEKAHLKGLAAFASNADDPHITDQVDSEEEDEDFILKPDDNLLAVGTAKEGEFFLEVHVFNAEEESFYVHHDYQLTCPAVCVEAVNYDPGSEHNRGNLCAVGMLDATIELWDLDIVESLEPLAVLGAKKKKKKSKAGANGDNAATKEKKQIVHTDAVLDLSWNSHRPHILASCSADTSVILWDLDKCKGSTVLQNHTDKVQSVQWHPVEDNLLLSGGADKIVNLWDARTCESQRQWSVYEGEIEKLAWNCWNPFTFVVTTDSGDLYYIDSRNDVTESNCVKKAHKKAVSGLSINPMLRDCLATCSVDGTVKIWHLGGPSLKFIATKKLHMRDLLCCSFCPDDPWSLAVGGSDEDLAFIWNIKEETRVAETFALEAENGGSADAEAAPAADENDENGDTETGCTSAKRKRKK